MDDGSDQMLLDRLASELIRGICTYAISTEIAFTGLFLKPKMLCLFKWSADVFR